MCIRDSKRGLPGGCRQGDRRWRSMVYHERLQPLGRYLVRRVPRAADRLSARRAGNEGHVHFRLLRQQQVHGSVPVSYTHLDVYKRQLYSIAVQKCLAQRLHGPFILCDSFPEPFLDLEDKDLPHLAVGNDEPVSGVCLPGLGQIAGCLLYTSRCV